jgi:short-subunit dehydrogenase
VQLDGCTALITGASAGLGAEFARQLAGRAGGLVLVARRLDRLEQLRTELTARDPNLSVHVRAVDLSQQVEVTALLEWLEREGIDIDLLINNAGVGDHGPFATSAPERLMAMLGVNVAALTVLTRALLPTMIARKRGAILNVSSSASFLPLPDLAAYAATKAYVTSLSEALRMELRGSGVSVSALCPGPVHTEFNTVASRQNRERELAPEFTYVSPEEVVRVGLAAIEHDQPIAVPGVVMKLAMLLVRLTPMPILRAATRFRR